MLSRNVFIATGVLVFVYIVMKIFMNNSGKISKKETDTDKPEENTEEKIEKKTESAPPEIKVEDYEKPMKYLKSKPNFFVAFQVNNSAIHLKVKQLQEKLIAKNPSLLPALIRVSTLHVTLAVTYLANDTQIKTVKDKLDEWAKKNLQEIFGEPCVLSFTGVNTFNNAVAYVDMEQCSNYKKVTKISNSVNDLLSSAGFSVDKRSSIPHLTFLKLSKDYRLMRIKRNFKDDFEMLKKCQEHFGKQEINSLQLLSMNDPKDEAGYYKCYHEIKVSDSQPDMDHSECCKPVVIPKEVAKKHTKNNSQSLKKEKIQK